MYIYRSKYVHSLKMNEKWMTFMSKVKKLGSRILTPIKHDFIFQTILSDFFNANLKIYIKIFDAKIFTILYRNDFVYYHHCLRKRGYIIKSFITRTIAFFIISIWYQIFSSKVFHKRVELISLNYLFWQYFTQPVCTPRT